MAGTVPVSVYMITFNNARTVERALRSVVSWAAEIVVVDSFSTDATPDLVRRFTPRLLQRAWPGFRDQYQFAADQCAHDWALFLDADEEVSPELAAELQAELARNLARPEPEQVRGYYGHRRTWFLGRWIRHGGWVPDYETRLYDRRRGRWLGDLHANIRVNGPTAHLRGFYYHYTYANLSEQVQKTDLYAGTAAVDMRQAGTRFSLLQMLVRPLNRFLRDYLLKGGFRDGLPGFILAVNTMYYVFLRYAKLWELERVKPETKPEDTRP